MKKTVNVKLVIAIFLFLLLLLGLCIGASIVIFVRFINTKQEVLAIIAYALLGAFSMFLLVELFIFIYYQPLKLISNLKEKENEKQ